ncbi:MAG: hypothetical protein ACYC3O_07005 [Burkholderiales bacterium]
MMERNDPITQLESQLQQLRIDFIHHRAEAGVITGNKSRLLQNAKVMT